MNIQKQPSKFQIHRENLQSNSLHVIHIDQNLKHLCRLLETGRTSTLEIQKQTSRVLKNNSAIIKQNKQSSFLKFIVKNKTSIYQQKEKENDAFKSLIIKQSQRQLKPLSNQIISGRQKKSFSVQQQRRFSTSYQKVNQTFKDIEIGPWEDF